MVVFGQEMHVREEELAEAQRWCSFNGWAGLWAPALRGVGNGTVGGVNVLCPKRVGVGLPMGITDPVVVPG
eukprot:11113313-Lingulodinium_polyedra.AAC.1